MGQKSFQLSVLQTFPLENNGQSLTIFILIGNLIQPYIGKIIILKKSCCVIDILLHMHIIKIDRMYLFYTSFKYGYMVPTSFLFSPVFEQTERFLNISKVPKSGTSAYNSCFGIWYVFRALIATTSKRKKNIFGV